MPVPGDSLHVFEVVPSELLHLSAADVSLSRKLHEKPQLVREQLSLKHTVWKLNQMLTETERQTDRQAGRQAGRQAETDRQTDRETERDRKRGGKKTSGNGQVWSSPSPRQQCKKNGGNWL